MIYCFCTGPGEGGCVSWDFSVLLKCFAEDFSSRMEKWTM